MHMNRLNAPLYWRGRTRSCPPVAGACWTLLREETETPSLETYRTENKEGVMEMQRLMGDDIRISSGSFIQKFQKVLSTPAEPEIPSILSFHEINSAGFIFSCLKTSSTLNESTGTS